MQHEKVITAAVLLPWAILAAMMVLYATAWGPWAGSDTVEYLEAARNLAAGRGLVLVRASGNVVPLYGRPPLYSVLLAGLAGLGFDPVEAVRFLNAALLAALLGLVGSGVRSVSGLALASLACLFLLTDEIVVVNFSGMMTEPLFVVIVAGQLASLAAYLSGARRWTLWLSAVLAGLALLTRYAGAACVLVLVIGEIGADTGPLRRRIGRALGAALVALGPFLLWTALLAAAGETPGVYRQVLATAWQDFKYASSASLDVLWSWIPGFDTTALGHRTKLIVTAGLFLLGAAALAWIIRRRGWRASLAAPSQLLPGLLLIGFSLAHATVIVAAYLVVRFPRPVFDGRVLLPSYLTLILGVVLLGTYILAPYAKGRLSLLLAFALLLPFVISSAGDSRDYVRRLHDTGSGYTAKAWRGLPILAVLDQIPEEIPIVSDDIEAVTFFARRPAFLLPDLNEAIPREEWKPFGQTPSDQAEMAFAERGGFLVLFSSALPRLREVYGEEAGLRRDVLVTGLDLVYEGADGAVYRRPSFDLDG